MNVRKLLFVIQTRTHTSRTTERSLTDQERLEGWYDGAEHNWCLYKDKQNNEGHESGRLHSMPEGQILTWEPEPGDRVLCTLRVDFEAVVLPATEDRHEVLELIAAELDREVSGPAPDHHRRFVFCDSVLGRAVMLGEDGAEDASGEDELRRTLECALEGDWRKAQCTYRLEDLPAALRESLDHDWHAAYPTCRQFAELRVVKTGA